MKKFFYIVLSSLFVLVLTACGATESNTAVVVDESNDGASSSGIVVGAKAPDFTLANAAGGDVSLADYSGQPVLLYFHMAVG